MKIRDMFVIYPSSKKCKYKLVYLSKQQNQYERQWA